MTTETDVKRRLVAPKRIQRKRTKGWRLPPNTVCVDRPSKWANPFTVAKYGREGAIARFRHAFCGPVTPMQAAAFMSVWDKRLTPEAVKLELRGKDLAAWCRLDQSCHADVLLEVANG